MNPDQNEESLDCQKHGVGSRVFNRMATELTTANSLLTDSAAPTEKFGSIRTSQPRNLLADKDLANEHIAA